MKIERLDQRLDSLGLTVLREIQKIPEASEAILAGGYIRDLVCKKQFKDIDIFLPSMKVFSRDSLKTRMATSGSFVLHNAQRQNFGDSEKYNMEFAVYDYKYLDSVSVQLIITGFPVENFVQNLLNSFDYGMCQVYSKDEYIFGTDAFESDRVNRRMTLLNINNLHDLPRHMSRFLKLQQKYPEYVFHCPDLSLNKPEKYEKKTGYKELYNELTTGPYGDFPQIHPIPIIQGGTGAVSTLQETVQNLTAPPAGSFQEAVSHALTTTLDDILNEEGGLDWDTIDELFALGNVHVDEHANNLINQWDNSAEPEQEVEF